MRTYLLSTTKLILSSRPNFVPICLSGRLGGIYLDIKSKIRVPRIFGNIIQPEDEAVLDIRLEDKEPYRIRWHYGIYEQWFLAYAPGHPYLKITIDLIVKSINERVQIRSAGRAGKFKHSIMRLTGPDAYSAAIHLAVVYNGIHHREVDHRKWLRYSANAFRPHFEYAHGNVPHYRDMNDPRTIYASSSSTELERYGATDFTEASSEESES